MVMREASSGPGLTAGQLLAARALSLCLSVAFAALLIYTIAVDGSPFRASLLTPWMSTTLVDYYLSCAPLYAVVFLREARGGGGGGGGGIRLDTGCAGGSSDRNRELEPPAQTLTSTGLKG